MSLMNKEQRTVENAAVFRRELGLRFRAGIGVLMTRSREPYRAIDTIRQFAFADNTEFKAWTLLRGWETFNRANPEALPTTDSIKDPMMALQAIGADAATGFGNGVYVMFYPHPYMTKILPFMQQVKEYAKTFTENKKRLILLCPMGTTLPTELEDDIPILDFDAPSFAELTKTLRATINAVPESKRPRVDAAGMERLLNAGIGLTDHEAAAALARAIVQYGNKLPNVTVDELAETIMDVKVEAVKKTEILEIMEAADMKNVGGLDELKEWVSKRANVFSDEARAFGIEAPKGIMLIGPPGTGKSLVGKAIASLLGYPALRFDVGKVLGSLVGQSEERVRQTLKLVEGMAPCVLLFDEIDKMLGGAHQGGGDSGVMKRVLGAILTWMQETKAPVFNVMTANRVDSLPSELLRKGRVDEIFSVSVPDEEERRAIFRIHLGKRGHTEEIADIDVAIKSSDGYVPAELEGAVKDALIEAWNTPERKITGALIAKQLETMKPLSQSFAEDFAKMKEWAENNARPASRGTASQPQVRQRVRTVQGGLSTGPRSMELGN